MILPGDADPGEVYVHTFTAMSTVVSIQVVGHGGSAHEARERAASVEQAATWFHHVEACCSRFDPESELMQLSRRAGEAVTVSPLLYEAVQFALEVARESDGAFDPTVGHAMETHGFDRNDRTGQHVRTAGDQEPVTYKSVRLDPEQQTICLERPLILDLGAVAKGLAIDLAARELLIYRNYAIDAGGDLYLAGCSPRGAPWTVGIRHPRDPEQVLERLHVSDSAVCTSGDYERRSPLEGAGHHILDPRTGASAEHVASVTVVAPTAMLADALATAAFVLGPVKGITLLERHSVTGIMLSAALDRYATRTESSRCRA